MSLELDPFYHTETMVKILREQGCTQHAMELAELILREHPESQSVREILKEMKEEAKKAFERFVGARFIAPAEGEPEAEPQLDSPAVDEEINPAPVFADAGQHPVELSPDWIKVAKLRELLGRVEKNRKVDEASKT